MLGPLTAGSGRWGAIVSHFRTLSRGVTLRADTRKTQACYALHDRLPYLQKHAMRPLTTGRFDAARPAIRERIGARAASERAGRAERM